MTTKSENPLISQIHLHTMSEEIKDELTYKIIGCAMKVHSTLGNGFQELIYQRALAVEFEKQGIRFDREVEMPIFYEERNIGSRRADFVVHELVLVELKALIHLEDVHLAQGLNYLVAYKLDKGLLINFGARSLQVKRLRRPTRRNLELSDGKLNDSEGPGVV